MYDGVLDCVWGECEWEVVVEGEVDGCEEWVFGVEWVGDEGCVLVGDVVGGIGVG